MQNAPDPTGKSTQHAGVGKLIAVVAFFSVFTNLLMLTGPLFMLQVYDRVLGSRSEETLVALAILVAGLYFFYWLIELARGRVAARVGARIQSTLDAPAFKAVLENEAVLHGQIKTSPLRALTAVRSFFTSPVFLSLLDLPWTPLFFACIFVFHPMLGWLALGGGGLLIAIAIVNQVLTYGRVADANRVGSQADRFAAQSESASELIWAQGMGDAVTGRWRALREQSITSTMTASDWTGSFSSLSKAFRLFLQSAILAMGAWLVLQSQITAGAMIAASILMGRALAPVDQCIAQWAIVQQARDGWRSLKDALQAIDERKKPMELPAPEAQLTAKNVTVPIKKSDTPVLRQVSFAVEPGEALGVIGKSGSGKTTLARVLMGLIKPALGEIRLSRATLDQYGQARLGRYIGYLPQNIQLFDGTIADNIAQMKADPDPAKVVAAAKMARVHDIILDLPNGYDTLIQSGDAQLSGGQKQRLALARALYNDPVLLVLDEPNSALDADGSTALNDVVRSMKADGKAVIIMTHRPTAISACDKLLVLEKGAVVGYGPRDEIVKSMMRNASDVHRVVSKTSSDG